ncbi:lipid phosphate phosphatase epsilon 2, chloroplastic isoform X2 [Brachypodium distachyon]|uniref:lipid phosphate phosphatase epsilon 2, chloroplastic isoform X2 n=1 Tax=Brachypodium distachyon TaxID=15368 RepID=UPI0001C74C2F|nr:lipid phosphate phosphatase epsilon 2, chloroplastic isoform X2 [Brachypodium distachyon]|eukprot:XP_010235860.1 lipid phosphate phosphatase epsilon 2, chloroplastic isoform X2 [Brachypodium distachyon]
MLLSPSAPWPRIKPVRLNRPPQCKDRLSLHRGRRPRAQRRLGVCMAEMARIGSGSSREAGVSDGESDPILRAELPGPGREAVSWWTPVEAALNRMSKWLVAGSFAFAALWKHDAEIMWALMGAVVNTVLSSILKQMFNHERPAPALRSDPGMPSSHAQSIFYAATFLVLSLFYSLGTNYLAMIIGAATIASASYLGLHTLNQIIVGATVGSAFGALWLLLWHLHVQEAFASSLWVQITVILGSVAFCIGFIIYIIHHWLKVE